MSTPAAVRVILVRHLVLLLGVAALLLLLLSLWVGRVWLPPAQLLGDDEAGTLARLIVVELRLPRALLALAAGAALGLSGAVLQGLTRNPLAEPGLLGVSSGAAFGAVLAIYFGLSQQLPLATPLFGLAGAFAATLLTLRLGAGGGVLVLVLAGAAVSGLLLALMALALNLAPNPFAAYELSMWILGSVTDKSWGDLALAAPFMMAGAVVLAGTGPGLDRLSLGELQARSLGVDLPSLQRRVLVGTALAVGAATAVTGAIGFIGLVAPHLVRPAVDHEPSRVLLPSALSGGLLLLAADLLTRLLPLHQELKLGVVTALIGSPFFIVLVRRLARERP
jgi:iron complex transport system permease protein